MSLIDRVRALFFPAPAVAMLPAPEPTAHPIALDFSAGPVVGGWPSWGKTAGYLDANPEVSPQELYGLTPRQLGVLFRMRYAHPVIGAAMDYARREMETLTYELEPADDSALAEAAAIAVAEAFTRMPGWSLPRWIAWTVDMMRTYGFCAYELASDDGESIYPAYIAPHLLDSWLLDASYVHLTGARVFSAGVLTNVPISRIAWYGTPAAPGNFYGVAELRKLLALFAAYEQDLQMYLDQQRLARGILYLEQTTEIAPSQTSISAAVDWLLSYFRREERPFVAPYGLKPAVVTVQNPTISEFGAMLERYNVQFREALMSSLGSLGIGGDGARALGEEFRIVDKQRFRAAVESYLRIINGETSEYSGMLRILTLNAGYPAHVTPRVVTRDNTGADAAANRADLVALVGAGLLSRADLSADSIDRLIRSLGLEPASAEAPNDGDGDGDPTDGRPVADPSAAVQTRARRMPSVAQSRILDALTRTQAAGVTIDPVWGERFRAWAMGALPTDDDVRGAMAWLRGDGAAQALAARAGSPEWYAAQLWGGRVGAEYWQAEAKRRGV